MIHLPKQSDEMDGPRFLKAVAVDLVGDAISFLVEIRQFEPIFYLELAIDVLGASSEKKSNPMDDDATEDEEIAILRSCTAENINDAILVLKAIGEGRPIPHLVKAFAMLPGFSLVPKRSSHLEDILMDDTVPFAQTLVTAAEQPWTATS
ncbi:hypothetical protein SAMN06295912_11256 [Sphingomonas laterariae]|uniref:Uncharacterized protein n=1 Tax=Edaphosphingomonas laterariae TaxID=861865 RepID=A0A239GH00_9SPHN|nr:hypothetical protein [Sphingomonas laterariae]SNS68155.1 hypothetical protein SAMN06295912_11256 [Sphingomonas laterariae]